MVIIFDHMAVYSESFNYNLRKIKLGVCYVRKLENQPLDIENI